MKKIIFVLLLLPVIVLWGCGGQYSGFTKTETGLYYKFYHKDDKAQQAKVGDVLTVLMTYRTNDTVLFSSSSLPDAFRFPLDQPGFKGDIFEGLAMMHVGDSATFIIAADSLRRYGNLPPLDTGIMLYFDVKLVSIQLKADFDKDQEKLKQIEEEALEKMKQIESEDLAKYLTDNNIKVKPSPTGLYFISKRSGGGARAVNGKVAEIHYSAEFLDGRELFSSRDDKGESIFFELGNGFEIPGIEEALKRMNAGGQAKLIVPSSLAYGAKGIKDMVPPYSPLVFDLELLSVMDTNMYKAKMEVKEKENIADYIKGNNIKTAPDENGLYYIELKKGNGAMAAPGKTARVNYTGKFLDGRVFDSSSENGGPIEFKIGAGEALPGWDMGLLYMKAGGYARLIIPSKLGFGSTYNGIVPPYTPLVYEIELLSVK
jgi:FKBP-type peptidyl-prolyl cis-trans isomerase FkpA